LSWIVLIAAFHILIRENDVTREIAIRPIRERKLESPEGTAALKKKRKTPIKHYASFGVKRAVDCPISGKEPQPAGNNRVRQAEFRNGKNE
jgi:hypothetical protein